VDCSCFVTKATSILKPDLIAIVVIAALAIAAVTSFRAGGRYRRSITPAQHDRGSVTG
jgi:hypothetical protein